MNAQKPPPDANVAVMHLSNDARARLAQSSQASQVLSLEALGLVRELLKYTARAKDDAIDVVTAIDRLDDARGTWDGTRQDATHVLGALRNIQDIATELHKLLEAAG